MSVLMETTNGRAKLFYLTQRGIRAMFNTARSTPTGVCITEVPGVPEDARVVSVFPAPERLAIGVVLEHQSFDLIPEGQPIPEAHDRLIPVSKVYRILYEYTAIDLKAIGDANLAALYQDCRDEIARRMEESKSEGEN